MNIKRIIKASLISPIIGVLFWAGVSFGWHGTIEATADCNGWKVEVIDLYSPATANDPIITGDTMSGEWTDAKTSASGNVGFTWTDSSDTDLSNMWSVSKPADCPVPEAPTTTVAAPVPTIPVINAPADPIPATPVVAVTTPPTPAVSGTLPATGRAYTITLIVAFIAMLIGICLLYVRSKTKPELKVLESKS